jgi:hypothetical protein
MYQKRKEAIDWLVSQCIREERREKAEKEEKKVG